MTAKGKLPKTFKSLRIKQAASARLAALVIVVIIAGIGTYILLSSHAATPQAATAEAENGTKSGTTSVIADNSASSGNALQFGTVASGGSGSSGASCTSNCQPYFANGTTSPKTSWASKLDDEFNGTSLNTTNWYNGRRSCGSGNVCGGYNSSSESELFSPSNVAVTGGNLVLTATHTSVDGGTHPWTSGTVESKFDYTYGYFEARLKVPAPSVAWTAYWLTSSQGWPPEIDIFEFHFCGSQAVFNNHGTTSGNNSNTSGWPCSTAYGGSADLTTFHTYGLYWGAGVEKIYLDGVLQSSIPAVSNGVPSTPQFPIFDYAVDNGTSPPDGSQMVVDYFRVWQ